VPGRPPIISPNDGNILQERFWQSGHRWAAHRSIVLRHNKGYGSHSTALTFIASVNPVKYVGAEPVFMDCDDSLTLDPEKLRDFCEQECYFDNRKLSNKQTGKHIKAIIVIHIFGNLAL